MMNHIIFKFFFILFCVSCKSAARVVEPVGGYIISNVSVVDAVHPVRGPVDVYILNDIIITIAEEIDNGAQRIDATGQYLIPGLWDFHVHLTFERDLEDRIFDLFLINGITSVRDTGGKMHLVQPMKELAASDPDRYPRVKIAGPLLDGLPRVYDGSSPGRPDISEGLESVAAIHQKVDELAGQGVDLLKAYEMLSPKQYYALLARAKMHGLKVTGHIPLSMTVDQAAEAGLASIEHMRNLEMSMSIHKDMYLAERQRLLKSKKDTSGYALRSYLHRTYRVPSVKSISEDNRQAVLTSLSENNTWQVPTLALVLSGRLKVFQDLEWRKTFDYLPAKMEAAWIEYAEQLAATNSGSPDPAYMDWAADMIRDFQDHNIGIVAGTDCPIFFLTPGFSLHRELETLVDHGNLTNREALYAATVRPAAYFDLQDKIGTVEEGKIADLILLREDPLQDISHTRSINAVIKNGVMYDQQKLAKMKAELKAN